MDLLSLIKEYKLVSIARKVPVSDIAEAAKAVYKGGIRFLEITFDQADPHCIDKTTESISLVKETLKERMFVGAGTVLTVDQARAARDAGADFALAPDTNVQVIKEMKNLGMIAVPGALTPTEIMAAWNAGADIVKLFPAGNFGLSYLKAIRGPISHVPLMAVGGVDENNVRSFLEGGFCSCGIGSNIMRNDLIAQGDFDQIRQIAARFVANSKC